MTISNIRMLTNNDRPALEKFLKSDTDRTLFLQYNMHRGGLDYTGKPGESVFIGSVCNGNIQAVISLTWNGHIQLYTPKDTEQLCNGLERFLQRANRKVVGLNGATEYALPALEYLNSMKGPRQLESEETLYTLELSNLIIPELTGNPNVRLRSVKRTDYDTLVQWQMGYATEALGAQKTEELLQNTKKRIRFLLEDAGSNTRILEVNGTPVSRTNFTATLDHAVMIGGVWTPPEYRNKRYARAALAEHLKEARTRGVERAVLFTASDAAEKAYRAIGFEKVGNYTMILLRVPDL